MAEIDDEQSQVQEKEYVSTIFITLPELLELKDNLCELLEDGEVCEALENKTVDQLNTIFESANKELIEIEGEYGADIYYEGRFILFAGTEEQIDAFIAQLDTVAKNKHYSDEIRQVAEYIRDGL